jgi:hypothetical protein
MWARPAVCAALLSACALCAGCPEAKDLDQKGANQSLVEIGERAIENGETLEGEGRASEANISYKRALWAFRYHQHLTGEEPLLLDEAVEGVERTAKPGK